MATYLQIMRKYKDMLQTQLVQKQALAVRYALPGGLCLKRTGGSDYPYLMMTDAGGRSILIYLNERAYTQYSEAMKQTGSLNRRISQITAMLRNLDFIPVSEPAGHIIRLPRRMRGFRLLRGSVGISEKHHAFYSFIPQEAPGEYLIDVSYKKSSFTLPMIYVCENRLDMIPAYKKTAAASIDHFLDENCPAELHDASAESFAGISNDGNSFRCERNGDGFLIHFTYDNREQTLEYYPDAEVDNLKKYYLSLLNMEAGKMVDRQITRMDFREKIKYYERELCSDTGE